MRYITVLLSLFMLFSASIVFGEGFRDVHEEMKKVVKTADKNAKKEFKKVHKEAKKDVQTMDKEAKKGWKKAGQDVKKATH